MYGCKSEEMQTRSSNRIMKKTLLFKLIITGPDGIPHESDEHIDVDDTEENPNRVEEYTSVRHCLSEFKFTDEQILEMYNHFKVPIKDEDFSFLIQEMFDVVFCDKEDSVLLELCSARRHTNISMEEYTKHPKRMFWSCLDSYPRWLKEQKDLKHEYFLFAQSMFKHFTGKYDDSDLEYIDKFIKDNSVEWCPQYRASGYLIRPLIPRKK